MGCHICIYWTPETGCKHYLPDSKTVLEMAGYTIKATGKKFIVKKESESHRFDSLAKAARILIHDKK